MKVVSMILSFFICLTIYATPTDKQFKEYNTALNTQEQFAQYRNYKEYGSPAQHLSFYLKVLETLGVSPQKYKPSDIYANENQEFLFPNVKVSDYKTDFSQMLARIYNAITDTLNIILMPINFIYDACRVGTYIIVVFFKFLV